MVQGRHRAHDWAHLFHWTGWIILLLRALFSGCHPEWSLLLPSQQWCWLCTLQCKLDSERLDSHLLIQLLRGFVHLPSASLTKTSDSLLHFASFTALLLASFETFSLLHFPIKNWVVPLWCTCIFHIHQAAAANPSLSAQVLSLSHLLISCLS